MITSRGLASNGLLDRGSLATLHMASLGHLRSGGAVTPPAPSDGGIQVRPLPAKPLSLRERERLEEIKRKLRASVRRELDEAIEAQENVISVQALEAAIDRAQVAALAALPAREPSGRPQRPPLVTIDLRQERVIQEPTRAILPQIGDDIGDYELRLLLLLSW